MSEASVPPEPVHVCAFCGSDAPDALALPRFGAHSCVECAGRVGRFVSSDGPGTRELWPMLGEEDDDLEPEPKVRRSDGTSVELRQLTAELKAELPVEKRLELADTYGGLGMLREQILECAFVLSHDAPKTLAQRAFDLLFSRTLFKDRTLAALSGRLFPA